MFQFLGYNFCSDSHALDSAPSDVNNIRTIRLTNAIYDHLNVNKDPNIPFSPDIPLWGFDTIVNAGFNGNLSGGNIEAALSQLTAVRIKRRRKGEFEWITLREYPIKSIDDLTFVIEDRLTASGVEYEYAFVPILSGVEGNYTITTVLSKFKGVFLGDAETIFKFLYDVNYSSGGRVQQVGTFEPLGRKYPILIANGNLNYATGSVTASILNDDYDETGRIDRSAIVAKKKALLDYLTNHKAKVLKDWNGAEWLVGIVGNPQVTYRNGSGMGVPQVTFNWTEIGDADNRLDLYNSGLIDKPE